jgi:pyruvate-formate lyase-activating enzyme
MSLLWAQMRRSGEVRRGPTVLTIETTTQCNLECVTCHRRVDEAEPAVMSRELFDSILDDCDRGVELIQLFGMGEPLLDPHLDSRIEACSQKGISTNIATNATLLTRERARSLLESGLSEITFSLSTMRPEVFRRLRPGAKYAQVVRNVMTFLDEKRRSKSHVHVTVEALRTRLTWTECDAVAYHWSREPGVDAVRIRRDEFGAVPDPVGEREDPEQRKAVCLYLWQGPLLIRADGQMFPCCVAGLQGEPMANANQISFVDFWTGKQMADLRSRHGQGLLDPRLPCASCRAPKPIPLLSHLSYLAPAQTVHRARNWVEKRSIEFNWRWLQREII